MRWNWRAEDEDLSCCFRPLLECVCGVLGGKCYNDDGGISKGYVVQRRVSMELIDRE